MMTIIEYFQDFIMEAYADTMKYYEPDKENTTNVLESIQKVKSNDRDLKDLNLNNIGDIKEEQFCELFDALKYNDTLVKLSVGNCDVTDFACATLNAALEQNQSLQSLNLESNRISPDTLAHLFEAINVNNSGIIELHLTNQSQSNMGYNQYNIIGVLCIWSADEISGLVCCFPCGRMQFSADLLPDKKVKRHRRDPNQRPIDHESCTLGN
jgi:hypothetical protein